MQMVVQAWKWATAGLGGDQDEIRGDLATVSIDSVAVCIVSAFFILYCGDYLVLRYRMAAHLDGATSSVTFFYAAPIKGGKVRLFYDQPQVQTCVRSIFPWRGYEPCWYLKRHAIKIVS